MTWSMAEIEKVLDLMGLKETYTVQPGATGPMHSETEPCDSAGAQLIISEALRDDPRPLFVACQGTLTDIASAYLLRPEIADRLTVIWIGGGAYPRGGDEFNLKQDIYAANVVMKSTIPVWQVPSNIYKRVSVSLAELQQYVYPCGALGKYLFEELVAVNDRCADVPMWPNGGSWCLGDSPTIGLMLMEEQRTDVYDLVQAPTISYQDMTYSFDNQNRAIRVYKDANERITIQDFFAKLQLNYG